MSWFEWAEAPAGDFAVVGDPVSHSASPVMHLAAYEEAGLKLRYHAIRVAPGELSSAFHHLDEMGYRGINVTVPLKEEAFAWCESTLGIAGKVGAVNTVDLKAKKGINTDAPGFLQTLEDLDVPAQGRVLVLGAGRDGAGVDSGSLRGGISGLGLESDDDETAGFGGGVCGFGRGLG